MSSAALLETDSQSADSVPANTAPAAPASIRRKVLIVVALAAALGGGGSYGLATRGHVSTDDAQVDADIVAVQVQAPGTIREVLFDENRPVRAGQVLVVLDDTEYRARLAEARATLLSAEAAARIAHADVDVVSTRAHGDASVANATARVASAAATTTVETIQQAQAEAESAQAETVLAESNFRRMQTLHDAGSLADANLEEAATRLSQARASESARSARLAALRSAAAEARGRVAEAHARVEQTSAAELLVEQARARAAAADAEVERARAKLEIAEIALRYTRVVAPADGYVSRRNAQVGQIVQIGHGIAQLVRPARWITANFKETQIENMHVGQPVEVEIDAFPGSSVWATVESMSGATGSRFTLLPPDNASGNFTKVVQRVPVRLRVGHLPESVTLLPGMNVEVTVHTRGGRS